MKTFVLKKHTKYKLASNRVIQSQKRPSGDVSRFRWHVPSYNEFQEFLKTKAFIFVTPCTVLTYTKSPKPTMQHLIIGHPELPPHSRPPVLPGFTLQHAGVGRGKATCRQADTSAMISVSGSGSFGTMAMFLFKP